MRSSPKCSGQGLSDATHAVASGVLAAESLELTPVAGELLALGVDDVWRRALDEALVREHPLGARDLLAEPLELCRGISVAFDLPTLDGLEDPPLVLAQLRQHAAAPE